MRQGISSTLVVKYDLVQAVLVDQQQIKILHGQIY